MFERLAQLPTGKRILKNFSSLAIADVISRLIGFVTIAYLARVLNASGFGQISFAQAIIAYFTLLSDLGLTTFGIREVARDKEHIKKYVNNILTLKLILAIISFALVLVFLGFINKPIDYKTLIAFYGLSLFPSVLFLNWVFQGIERMEFIGVANILRSLVYAAFVFLFVNSPSQMLSVPLFALAASFIMIIPLIYTFVKHYGWFRPSFNRRIWKSFLRNALPMGLSMIMITVYYNMDSVMLGFIKGSHTVGLYNAAYKGVLLLLAFRSIFIYSLFPQLSRLYLQSVDRLAKLVLYAQKLGISLAIPLGVGGTLLAKPIIALVYGAQYQGSVVPFQLLIWDVVIVYVDLVFPQLLNAANRQKLYATFTMTGAAVNMLFNFLLITKYGMIGAAIATVLAETTVLVLSYAAAKRFLAVSISHLFWRPMVASLVMAFPLVFFRGMHVMPLILIGIASYSVVLLLIRGISAHEISRLLKYGA